MQRNFIKNTELISNWQKIELAFCSRVLALVAIVFISTNASADCSTQQCGPDPIVVYGSNLGNTNCYTDCYAPYDPPVVAQIRLPITLDQQMDKARKRFMNLCRTGTRANPELATDWLVRALAVCNAAAAGKIPEIQACGLVKTNFTEIVSQTHNTPVIRDEEGTVTSAVRCCVDLAPPVGSD